MGETIEKLQRDVAQWKPGTTSQQLENGAEMVESSVLAAENRGVHRFLPGNPGGPGRPKKEVKEAHFRDLIRMNTTDTEFLAVWRSIVEGAAAGHNHKQKLFCAYLLGNPTQYVETNSNGLLEILAMLGPGE